MAYLRYKELTKYFNFYKRLDLETLPSYVGDYIEKNDNILLVYATRKDKGVFTEKKMVLFDITIMKGKKMIIIPYSSISTMSITFRKTTAAINLYTDSGYPITLKFRNLNSMEKAKLRVLYTTIADIAVNKKHVSKSYT